MDAASNLPLIERNVVRVVLLDNENRVLLLQVGERGNPEFGTAWELPGGGIEAGETHEQAVMRELREETGIVVTPEQIREASWRRDVLYDYRGARRLQHEAIFAVRLQGAAPEIQSSQRDAFEQTDLFAARWWTVNDIVASDEWFYPRSLPALLERFLSGESIEEAMEVWDKTAWSTPAARPTPAP